MNLLEKEILDQNFIGTLIPQKFPFVMVDKLLHFSEEKIVAGLTIKKENIFTKDNVFAESGIIEHMAQTIALYTGYQFFLTNKPAPTGYLGAIKKVEIKKLPKLNEEMQTTARILHEILGVTMVDVVVTLNKEIIASAEIKTVIVKE